MKKVCTCSIVSACSVQRLCIVADRGAMQACVLILSWVSAPPQETAESAGCKV
jgi:hypothetical protein